MYLIMRSSSQDNIILFLSVLQPGVATPSVRPSSQLESLPPTIPYNDGVVAVDDDLDFYVIWSGLQIICMCKESCQQRNPYVVKNILKIFMHT